MHETCLFCHTSLGDTQAPHLVFLDHVASHPDCAFDWSLWKDRLREDWRGD